VARLDLNQTVKVGIVEDSETGGFFPDFVSTEIVPSLIMLNLLW